MTESFDDNFGLLFFNDIIEKNKFISNINNDIKNQKYRKKYIYKGSLIENEESIISKNELPSWYDKRIFKNTDTINNNELLETKKYRIIFKNIKLNIYYFEKNGAINCIDKIIKENNYIYFEKKLWNELYDKNKSHSENVINYMNNYTKINFHNELIDVRNLCDKELHENIINIKNFNYDYFNFYELFKMIKEINIDFKLPPYNKNTCINSLNQQSETVYNSLVFENNPHKYLLLDKKCIKGCEVADLYDKENNLLFHNKKREEDIRILSLQIMIGALIMKNKDKNKEYFDYLQKNGINDLISDNFKYVIGIIGNNKKTAEKDKISLGIVNFILKQHNIELYIDHIDVI